MTFRSKKKYLLIAILLANVAMVLGFNAKKWFSPEPVEEELQIQLFVSSGCINEITPITIKVLKGKLPEEFDVSWNFGDGSPSVWTENTLTTTYKYGITGPHTITATIYWGEMWLAHTSATIVSEYCQLDISPNCCDGSFAPIPGKEYVLSAWVKEAGVTDRSFENAHITLAFFYVNAWEHQSQEVIVLGPFQPKGNIIDGWQRIEQPFTVPDGVETMSVRLNNSGDNDNVFFDDVRIHPFDGNMKSYVYDPDTKRLMAEMDQNNYATFYEYNEEGELIRVKKETERGVMTVSEYRNATVKRNVVE